MEWINVNEKYLDYLRKTEPRIPKTDYGTDKYKPFFGVLFEIGDLYYVTQVSHPQDKHKELKQKKDFFMLFDPNIRGRLIAVVNLNYMFPIPKEQTSPFVKKKIHTYKFFSYRHHIHIYPFAFLFCLIPLKCFVPYIPDWFCPNQTPDAAADNGPRHDSRSSPFLHPALPLPWIPMTPIFPPSCSENAIPFQNSPSIDRIVEPI